MKDKENKKGAASGLYICQRIITILLIVGAFFPTFNPTRVARDDQFKCIPVYISSILQQFDK